MNILLSYPIEEKNKVIYLLSESFDDNIELFLPIKRVPRKIKEGSIIYVCVANLILAEIKFHHFETLEDNIYHPVTGKIIERGNYIVCKGNYIRWLNIETKPIQSWKYTEEVF